MGYRSDVHSIIYDVNLKKMRGLVMGANLKGIWPRLELYVQTVHVNVGGTPMEAITLKQESIKWYDEFDYVKAWRELLDLATKMDIAWEFVRVGEDVNDVEHDSSMSCYSLLYVSRSIQYDYYETDPEPETTEKEETNG